MTSDPKDAGKSVFPNSLWEATAIPPVARESLSGEARADVAVIGAGFTGLSAALHLAERGTKVRVLEEHTAGWGTSGRAGGQVIAGYHRDPNVLLALYGPKLGERMIRFGSEAPNYTFQLIKKHRIECEPQRSGWIQATAKRGELKRLERRAEMWAKRGADVQFLDGAQLARLLGSKDYAGGWLDERGGTVQPLSYARGLAGAAVAAGAVVNERTRALRMQRDGTTWKIETGGGVLVADTVLICTNAYTSGLWPRLRHTMMRAHSVQIATGPLPEAIRRSILPGHHCCADTRRLTRYFRVDRAGRFVIGGPGPYWSPRGGSSLSFRALEKSARRMFPQLGDVPFEFRWFGRGALTFDLLPHLYEPAPGLYAALGYNGRGIAMGTALGLLLARRTHGEEPESLPFPVSPLSALPRGFIRGVYAGLLSVFARRA